ncbi:unnamed protein product [Cylicocyclus nassatus]|uniref:Uncharacterized protein n=1 Tax=Cylicocyclus nassatus TaxID=53992 RepID=A0AA36DNF1_CYLNA|nr:unnamed protein product [Cylicocyclus nassatus]
MSIIIEKTKHDAWQCVKRKLQNLNHNTQVDEIQRRWKSMRDTGRAGRYSLGRPGHMAMCVPIFFGSCGS